jgi:hypothetical protein
MKLKTAIITPLLIIMGLNADSITGTTVGHYSKPGAPINISYDSQHVQINETADINISLSTTVRSGTMSVSLTLDDKLTLESDTKSEITFQVTPEQKIYPIQLKVSAKEDGLYYIRLLTKIDKGQGSKLRAFAVPVTIGEGRVKKVQSNVMMKSLSGERISVSKAVETIQVLEE